MRKVSFTQFQVLQNAIGDARGMMALDEAGRLWWWDNQSWALVPMPEHEKPKTAWEALLEAQERLRAEGRTVDITDEEGTVWKAAVADKAEGVH